MLKKVAVFQGTNYGNHFNIMKLLFHNHDNVACASLIKKIPDDKHFLKHKHFQI